MSGDFLYERVMKDVLGLVRENNIQVGERLPSERKLAATFGCDYLTLRKAVALMEKQRIVERRPRKGTFLKSPVDSLEIKKSDRLSFKFSRLIAALIQPDAGDYTGELFNHITEAAEAHGAALTVYPINDFDESSLTLPARLAEQGCKGVILKLSPFSANKKLREFLELCSPIPVVMSSRHDKLERFSHEPAELYGLTTRQEARFACEYFLELGYENICYLAPPTKDSKLNKPGKTEEYKRCVKEFSLKDLYYPLDKTFQGVGEIIANLAPSRQKTAVICVDDNYAMKFMTALYKRGFSTPQDFALIGCNNIEDGNYAEPPLSTFNFPYHYLSNSLVGKVLRLAGERDLSPMPGIPDVSPVIRMSCGGKDKLGNKLERVIRKIKDNVLREIPIPSGLKSTSEGSIK